MNNSSRQGYMPPPRGKPQDEMLLTLCHACAQQFYDAPEHKIRRADYQEVIKQDCDYCAVRRGFCFIITKRG